MNKLTRLLATLLIVAMVFSLAISASATTITITGGAEGATYKAWKLMSATKIDNNYSYTVEENFRTALQSVTGQTTDDAIIEHIAAIEEGTAACTFADAVYAQVKDSTPTATTENNVFSNIENGYYLIAETATGADPDTYSLVMLNTITSADSEGNVDVATKEDAPTLEKKVKEDSNNTWQDGADYDIGDDVPFKLTGTVSDKYDSYDKYYYVFHDTLSTGLQFNENSVTVKVGDTELEKNASYTVNATCTDGCSFEVVFNNLKDVKSVEAGATITVEYTAKLMDTATVGQPGNPNTAKLEFSNNPYSEEETDFTPIDKVVVFTYKSVVNKVDGKGTALQGAGFTLYKYNGIAYVKVGEELKGETMTTFEFKGLDAGQYKIEETTVPPSYNKAADIEFKIEAGYDTKADDPKLNTLVVKDLNGNEISGENLTFTATLSEGAVTTTVVNKTGAELPSTGGIGTTIFYVLGGILMTAAVVLLVTKKRMNGKA